MACAAERQKYFLVFIVTMNYLLTMSFLEEVALVTHQYPIFTLVEFQASIPKKHRFVFKKTQPLVNLPKKNVNGSLIMRTLLNSKNFPLTKKL